jgi:hypothetical protein
MKPTHQRTTVRKRPARRWASLLTLLCAASSLQTAQAQGSTPGPDAVELELWKGASLINTPSSYRAYLNRYPNGAFAEMARAGLSQPATQGGAQAPAAPQVGPTRLQLDGAALRRQAASTSAVEFGPGAFFVGPGFVTAGHWGAKRQLAIPSGRWVVVAATDHSLVGQQVVQLTTVGLLRTDSEAAGSTLFITFNRRSLPAVAAPRGTIPSWEALDSCFSKSAVSLVRVPSSDMKVQWCTAYREEAEVPKFAQPAAAFLQDWAAALKQAQAALPAHQVSVESHVLDKQGQFTSYLLRQRSGLGVRLLSSTSPDPYDTLPANLNATQLAEATQGMHFTLVAARAHQRVFESYELKPDGEPVHSPALDRVLVQIE